MRKQRAVVIVTAFVVFVLLGLLAAAELKRTRRRIIPIQIEQDIRAHIPIGSSKGAVDAYLDNKNFAHSYAEYCNCEIALIRDTAYYWPIRTDTQIHFNFDRELTLASYSVREIYTGP